MGFHSWIQPYSEYSITIFHQVQFEYQNLFLCIVFFHAPIYTIQLDAVIQ